MAKRSHIQVIFQREIRYLNLAFSVSFAPVASGEKGCIRGRQIFDNDGSGHTVPTSKHQNTV